MPISLADLQQNVAKLSLKLGDDDLTVSYRPGLITQAMRNNLIRGAIAFVVDGEDVDGAWRRYFDAIASLLVSWDILGEDDKPLPITTETLATLPLGFIEALIGEVAKDARKNPQIVPTSRATSAAAA